MEIFARWFKKVNLWFAVGAMIAIGVMIVSTTADTTSRYALNYPLKGVFELNELLMVLVLFFGVSWTQAERGHTRVVLGIRKFPMRGAIKVDIIIWVLCFIFMALMCWQTGREAIRSYSINEFRWGAVQMPIWWAKALIPLGCAFTCVQFIVDIWVDLGRLTGKFPLDLPDLRDVGD
jgi:TRAP-type C4-dicarboxylate transport system permease small subunit